jgi:hypothetical protein
MGFVAGSLLQSSSTTTRKEAGIGKSVGPENFHIPL